ncbi:pseudouridylate synthase RPUSD2-like [Schistocerca gregaria]|uniref:pseudouridylate synthase RPUSD2-like n=1 Tax=Schistocerca gregaria TaxID=7010 RepID=UPI00211E6B2D|nr:pseudouridylate synthase RPUSD2-like [Schistocerca gregaria]
MVGFDYVIKEHDLIMHRVHRHEPPVSGQEIKIIYQDEKLVVIDKPGSIPVHPSGRYRHNSVTFILAHEHGLMNLYTTYRLDRLTSGLLIFTKSSKDANDISSQIRSYDIEKGYLARVVGEFPEGKITVDQPIFIVPDIHRKEHNRISSDGKRCITQFERIFYRNNESLVRCVPKTGRTHQIRIHLKWLGYPIVNDPLYNEKYAQCLGPVLEISPPDTKEIEDIKAASKQFNHYNSLSKIIQEKIEVNPKFQSYRPSGSKVNINSIDPSPTCRDCKKVYRTPYTHEMFICLHALSYKTKSFLYKTDLPAWAEEGYVSPDWNSIARQQSGVEEIE